MREKCHSITIGKKQKEGPKKTFEFILQLCLNLHAPFHSIAVFTRRLLGRAPPVITNRNYFITNTQKGVSF